MSTTEINTTHATPNKPYAVLTNRVFVRKPGTRCAFVAAEHIGAHRGGCAGHSADHSAALLHYERELHRDALLRAIPQTGNVALDGFMGTVFVDSTLCAAYYERFIDSNHLPALAVNLATRAMNRAKVDPRLRSEERPVAAVAAFLMDAGVYLDSLENGRRRGLHAGCSEAERVANRNAALYYALRALRSQMPQEAALLGAVFELDGVQAECPVDGHQVARVRAAVLRAHSV